MVNYVDLAMAFMIAFIASFLLTYLVKKFAVKIGAVDFPNYRKIHKEVKPRLGGIAIFLGALIGGLYLMPQHEHLPEIVLGALVIIITGALDDRFSIKPIAKLTGQLVAASFIVSSGLIIERVTLPFIGTIDLGFFSVLITVLWVVGITNAINLIDGLDGLATGVTTIALISIFIMALADAQIIVAYISIVLIGANIGFLPHNFYPAKIYMGDTGSNFLGFMVAVVSMLGLFKNVAFLSFVVPIIVLAVPIFDTIVAIIRRAYNKENIMAADNKHIHYQLIKAGYSHRKTVLIIYLFSAAFGGLAILFSEASLQFTLIITVFVFLFLHIFAELAGIVLGGKRPVVDFLRKIFWKVKNVKEVNK
ncbi:undecaprenyl/decaprenyl-phosphate alpha-N-acetylglucosaminyl 1-phosphate transferase [Oceanobacillus luteolus]|uniref:glycosyltransferase family 4 protein n=1 Tax=Oceanobacillus luteolus TaxID=1274358 RepID=UPI00203AC0E4|nr:MraY family glycosyltransferase [Oceanobacillus luteolus]MCM3741624.1 undecaprenyl/decaprenyl-phosphate alpha-N-acetylglucosaminyl 1-phosphate transferase [Oceanobacillus luteolus]